MSEKDVYTQLAEKLGAPASKRFLAVLDAMLSPEEAKICLELFEPATCPELAARLNIDEKSLSGKLAGLVDRGIITRGETQFGFHTTLVAFHHDIIADTGVHRGPHAPSQKVKDLWADFFRNEWAYFYFLDKAIKGKEAGRPGPMPTPSITAIEMSGITADQLLPQEDWRETLKKAKKIHGAPCGCRIGWGTCDHPVDDVCMEPDSPRMAYYAKQPDRLVRELTLEQALDVVRKAEASGLVHFGKCWCCVHDCEFLWVMAREGRFDLVTANRFAAVVNRELCAGCQDCVERCPFNAVEMRKELGGKKLKASINAEACKGCGVCVVGCKQKAIRYEIVRPPEYLTSRMPRQAPGQKPTSGPLTWGYYELK